MISPQRRDPTEAIDILLVEDSPGDVMLTQEAFQVATVPNKLHITRDGAEAMAFLRREGVYAEAPRPDLILLDLNLPKKDGRTTLAEIKADVSLKTIPVLIFTSSAADADILSSYQLRANCYITKPVDLDGFAKVVRSVENFWFSLAQLPRDMG
jgi:chemotaxis family two-component system response regulator Rcp1